MNPAQFFYLYVVLIKNSFDNIDALMSTTNAHNNNNNNLISLCTTKLKYTAVMLTYTALRILHTM